jgi:organic radical activating enzyme
VNGAKSISQSHNPPGLEAVGGQIVEVFSGIQGEGIHVGRRQIFLRLAGCNLACDYCDQPEARICPEKALIELAAGSRKFIALRNPISAGQTARAILRLDHLRGLARRRRGFHHAVSVTGGEPLMQAGFLAALLPILRRGGLRVLLETNGTRPEEFRALRHLVNIVSMDFKLRSATGRPMPAKAHCEFLSQAVGSGRDVYVKAVVSSRTTGAEIARAARLIAAIRRAVPLILQPVTRRGRENTPAPPDPARLLELQAAAAKVLPDVRVIPQTHVIIGQR